MSGGIDIVHAMGHVIEIVLICFFCLDWMDERERKRRVRERKRREQAKKAEVIYGDEPEATY